jgi:peptidoglycan/LPS O-acetylase OafA/YrhL
MFYAIAPFLVRRRWWILVLIAAISIGIRAIGPHLDVSYHLWPRRMFPAELFLFLFGMLGHRARPWAERFPRWIGWLFAGALLVIIATNNLLPIDVELRRWVLYVPLAIGVPFIFHAFRTVKLDKWIGDLSYPVYICQFLVIAVVLHFAPPHALWIILASVVLVSILLLVLLERPLDALRQRRVNHATSEGQRRSGAINSASASHPTHGAAPL